MRYIKGEPCERVERFSDLGVGDVVYDLGCEKCRSECRSMLLRLHNDGRALATIEHEEPIWECLPDCRPTAHENIFNGINAQLVALERIWRVVQPTTRRSHELGELLSLTFGR